MKQRVPAGNSEARQEWENKRLDDQRQRQRGNVRHGVKVAQLVKGLALGRIALMARKQQCEHRARCVTVRSSVDFGLSVAPVS